MATKDSLFFDIADIILKNLKKEDDELIEIVRTRFNLKQEEAESYFNSVMTELHRPRGML